MNVQLHRPSVDELWFRQQCMSDPETMSYNAGYDVSYAGYHYDTGCIDFDKSTWQDWFETKSKNKNFYYAYIYDKDIDSFVGYVNYNNNPDTNEATMGIVVKSDYHGKGYMRPSLKLLIKTAKANGVKILTDTVPNTRENALRVFFSLGFVKASEYVGKKFNKDELVFMIRKTL